MVVLFLTGLNAIAQTKYQKGYIITNDNTKKECYIKNEDWINTPYQFKYKNTLNSEYKEGTIKNIKEFGIPNILKYTRFDVNIDQSSSTTNKLSSTRQSQFIKKTVFLKTLVEGKSSLFLYQNQDFFRFFYLKDNQIKQLEYKLYKDSKNRIGKNLNYLKQLREELPCKKANNKNLEYKEKPLVKYFITYNSCNPNSLSPEVKSINYSANNQGKSKFNLYARLGFNFSNLQLYVARNFQNIIRDIDFNSKTIYAPGFELEYVMPFNNNKWSVFIDPSYQSYKTEITHIFPSHPSFKRVTSVNYKSIELPIGIRHYLFLNSQKKHKLFFDLGINVDVPFNSLVTEELNFSKNVNTSEISFNLKPNFFLGFGYTMNEKYKVEFRYNTSRNFELIDRLNANTIHYSKSNYNTFSFIISYNFL